MLNKIAALEDTNRAVISVPATIVDVWGEWCLVFADTG